MRNPWSRCGSRSEGGDVKRRRRAITMADLAGHPGLRQAAQRAICARQPTSVAEALELAGVGRKTTRRLLDAGLLEDSEGLQGARDVIPIPMPGREN